MIWWESVNWIDYLMLTLLLLFLGYVYLTWHYDYFKKRNVPYRKPVLLFGNIAGQMLRKQAMADFVLEVYNYFKDYKVAGLFHLRMPSFMVRDPELLKLILVKDFDHFTNHSLDLPENVEPLMGSNLLHLKGEKWRRMRATLSPAFTSSKMKMMFHLIEECGEQLQEYLDTRLKECGSDVLELDIKDVYTRFANDVIATTAFGINCNSLKNPNNEFYLCGKELTNFRGVRSLIFFGYFMYPKIMAFLRLRMIKKANEDFLYSLVSETIKTREKEGIVRPDMLHLLMQASKGELKDDDDDISGAKTIEADKDTASKKELSATDITAQAVIFFLAGFETASTMLSFTSLLLAMHPDVQERLQEEIDDILRRLKGKITYEGLHSMKYIDMVISETLRMYPPVTALDRDVTKPYVIPATENTPAIKLTTDDHIFIPVFGLHYDPEYFPEPEKFDPERFSDENKHNIKPFTYMPFGLGPRVCIGNRFAMMELKIALINLLSKFDLVVTEKSPVPIKLATDSFQMAPEKGFLVGIKRRATKSEENN